MKRVLTIAALLGILALAMPAAAAERTVTLAIDGMTCASCPYIVKTTMGRVHGVSKVDVSYGKKTATVAFDDARATVEAIAAASAGAGFPARLLE